MVQMIAAEGHTAPAPTSVGQQGASNGTPIGDVGEAVVPPLADLARGLLQPLGIFAVGDIAAEQIPGHAV